MSSAITSAPFVEPRPVHEQLPQAPGVHVVGDRAGDARPAPAVRGLTGFEGHVLDPITQLVSFPSFHALFPAVLAAELAHGHRVSLAIGDVDNLKRYVERSRVEDDLTFGHLAGNDVMTRLGRCALDWYGATTPAGCLATFGGDEVILAMVDVDAGALRRHVLRLSALLADALPCTVSFAHATFVADQGRPSICTFRHYQKALVLVDRALFAAKKRPGRGRVISLRTRRMSDAGWCVAPGGRGR